MRSFPNGSWPRELDELADRIERIQKGYSQWMQKQMKGKSHARAKSRKIGGLRGAISRILRLLVGN